MCTLSKALAHEFIRVYGKFESKINVKCGIGGDEIPLETLMSLQLPIVTSKFALHFERNLPFFKSKPELALQFADKFGGQIKSLYITCMSAPIQNSPIEVAFYNKLSNLEKLSVCSLMVSDKQVNKLSNLEFPLTFSQLSLLHVDYVSCQSRWWNRKKSEYCRKLLKPQYRFRARILCRRDGSQIGLISARPGVVGVSYLGF